ncbi:MAG: DUF6468 domain-containing protein [Pseudomonadota bacterium]
MTLAAFVFEALVAVLLLFALIACWRLERRLKALRDGQDGMRETVHQLNEATDRARASLAALDRAARQSGAELQTRVVEARRVSDELSLLAERGDMRADALSRRPSRTVTPPPARPVEPEAASERGESRLLDALKAMR